MSAVEGVMEVLSGLLEVSVNLRVKSKGGFDDWADFSLDGSLELGEMSGQVSCVND